MKQKLFNLRIGQEKAQSVWRRATGWTTDESGFDSRHGREIFLYSTAFRPALGPTQRFLKWVPGVLSWGSKAAEA
jgi:hypothetical protein